MTPALIGLQDFYTPAAGRHGNDLIISAWSGTKGDLKRVRYVRLGGATLLTDEA